MNKPLLIAAATALGLLAGCSSKPAAESYPLPAVSPSITDPGERASTICARFWDAAVPAPGVDTVTPALEQAMANFAAIAPLADNPDSVRAGVSAMLALLGDEMVMPLAERYLFDANSPMRNEELFLFFLQLAPDWARTPDLTELVLLNRPGSVGADFGYVDAAGRRSTLGEFAAANGGAFIYFFDSECSVCKELIPRAAEIAGDMPVLAVCPDALASKFNEVITLFPADWTIARDLGAIDSDRLYDFQAFPAVYVVDPTLTVLAKDLPLQ